MASIFDLEFASLPTTPFGFDSTVVSGTASISSVGGSGGGVSNPKHGVGIRVTGQTVSTHSSFPDMDMMGMGLYWCDVEQTPGTYTWLTRQSGSLVNPDTSIDDAAANGYVIIMRLFMGVNMPIGGFGAKIPGGSTISWASKSFVHQGDNLAGVERVTFVSRDLSLSQITYVPWASDHTLRVLFQRLMIAMNTWLNGTTGGGNRRADYVIYVPMAMPTENGTEMTIAYQSGTFAPTTSVKMDNGITYGPGTSNPTGSVPTINKGSMYAHVPASAGTTDAEKQAYLQQIWQQAWEDNGDIQAANLAVNDMGLAYGSVWGSSLSGVAANVRDYLEPQYGKTKLFAQQTDYTVDYVSYNSGKANFMLNVLTGGGKLGFQTQDPSPTNGNPGLKPADWINAMEQALSSYKVHFIETQQQNFSNATDGQHNINFVKGFGTVLTAPSPATSGTTIVLHSGEGATMPPVPFNCIAWPNAQRPGNGNYETLTVTARSGDTLTVQRGSSPIAIATNYQIGCMKARLEANANDWATANVGSGANVIDFTASATDFAYGHIAFGAPYTKVYYLIGVSQLVSNTSVIILLDSFDDGGNHIQIRLTAANQPRIVVNGVADYTGASAIQNGDVLEVVHIINGAASGYIFRVNMTEIHRNLAFNWSLATQLTTVDAGIKSKVASEIQFSRFASDSANWVGDPVTPSNPFAPIIDLVSFS